METPQDLMRENGILFLEDLNIFKRQFEGLVLENIKIGSRKWGTDLTGVAIDPTISDKIIRKENDRNSK